MNLKCKIHGKEFPTVQGITFSEEYNETLDSGSLIIAHVPKIKKLRPYDDVYIYDNEFNGFGINLNPKANNKFYKHMLVQNFTEEIINLKDKIYKYKISLMSEIKALEKVQLPNISVTQPLIGRYKVSVYEYLLRFVEMYSPKYKKVSDKTNQKWKYVQKYTVDPALREIFEDVYPPDFTLNLPTLRDLLSKLMIVKDMIPYVEDNVIKAMDITARKKEFVLDERHMNYITGTMNSEDYCTGLRRTYSDALSQDSTCRSIENIGFRNSDSALMSLNNMRLETRFPIYKINKVYMCYYKRSNIVHYTPSGDKDKDYLILCKQDITPLVKLNTERNALSQDWDSLEDFNPITIEGLAQYKIATLGYDIGSKYITGWGESYTYPKGWWLTEKNTYIENIIRIVDNINETGIYQYDEYLKKINNTEGKLAYKDNGEIFENIITPFSEDDFILDTLKFKSAVDMKGLFFIIDYQGFYNGAIITAKDNVENDDIISNDNSSSSLALLELDGLSQKEKVNRFGNKTIQISARYESFDQLQELGDVYNNEDDTDVIIYHREYSIYDNQINCIYFGVKDYVLKNYYTSVFARHRTWNLIPYSESVRRSENRKAYLSLSKNKCYYELNNTNFINNDIIPKVLSFYVPSPRVVSLDNFPKNNKINYGYISYTSNNNTTYYLSDVNSFSCGNNISFNISLFDNISAGSYISKTSPFKNKTYDGELWQNKDRNWLDTKKDYSGSNISLYKIVDSDITGFTKQLGFYVAHKNNSSTLSNKDIFEDRIDKTHSQNIKPIMDIYEKELLILPKADVKTENLSCIIGENKNIYKDNKEFIDMTYQIELISNDKDILFSQYTLALSDLLENYNKVEEEYTYIYDYKDFYDYGIDCEIWAATSQFTSSYKHRYPIVYFWFTKRQFDKIRSAFYHNQTIYFPSDIQSIKFDTYKDIILTTDENLDKPLVSSIEWKPLKITGFKNTSNVYYDLDNYIEIEVLQKITIRENTYDETYVDNPPSFVTYETVEKLRLFNVDGAFEGKLPIDTNFYTVYKFDFASEKVWNDKVHFETTINNERKTFTYYDGNSIINVGNGKEFNSSMKLENSNFNVIKTIVSWDYKPEKTYYKNMYLLLSKEPLKNTLVYDEYTEENIPYIISFKNVSEIFEVTNNYINVNLKNLRNNGYKFNDTITTTDVIYPPSSATDDSYESIYLYCSFTSQDGVIYDRIKLDYDTYNGLKMYYREAKSNDNISVYNQLTGWVDEKYRLLKEDIVYNTTNDLNNFSKNEFDEWKTKNLEKQILDLSNINSIQYWFKDIKEEIGEKYVFGDDVVRTPFDLDSNPIITIFVNFRDDFGNYYNKIQLTTSSYGLVIGYGFFDYNSITVYSSEYGWAKKEYQRIKQVKFNQNIEGNVSKELFEKWLSNNSTCFYDENLMKFVFGVNLSEDDKKEASIKIYTSLISNRNPNVYDENHNIVGKVHNYVKNDVNKPYGTAQYYDTPNEEDID